MPPTSRLVRSPLSLRIILGMFVSLVVIEGILLVPSVNRRRAELLDHIEEVSTGKVRWIVTTYPTASGPEWVEHLQQLQGNPMLPDILGGAVYDAEGQLVGDFGEPPDLTVKVAATGQIRQQVFASEAGHRYDIAWTTAGIGEGMIPELQDNYWLVLRHNAEGTQRALALYMLRIAGLVLLIAAFITLVMMVLLSRQLITPILTLRRDLALAGEAVTGDPQHSPDFASLRYRRRDELGEVIATFEHMYRQINQEICDRKQAEAELRRHNQEMQQYIEHVNQITAAAAAVDEGTFTPASLDPVTQRRDQLGQLARMFQLMAAHVAQRERHLQAQLRELTIEIDQAKRQQQVSQITQSSYFQELQAEIERYQADDFWR